MQWQIPRGAEIFLGAPAVPMDSRRVQALRDVVSRMAAVEEAHLPQCFIIGVTPKPAKVLVVIGHTLKAVQRELDGVADELNNLVGGSEQLAVWPLAMSDDMVEAVREANCQLFARFPGKHEIAAQRIRRTRRR